MNQTAYLRQVTNIDTYTGSQPNADADSQRKLQPQNRKRSNFSPWLRLELYVIPVVSILDSSCYVLTLCLCSAVVRGEW